MALRPAELGGSEIRQQSPAAGISAQLVADSPEAARMLAQHGDELRRALEARDVTLLSLEVSTTADHQQQQSARGEWTDGDDAGSATSSGRSTGDAEGDAEPTSSPIHSTIELPGGLLVDVLA
jgi:flagellar hook-length control protein FliK